MLSGGLLQILMAVCKPLLPCLFTRRFEVPLSVPKLGITSQDGAGAMACLPPPLDVGVPHTSNANLRLPGN